MSAVPPDPVEWAPPRPRVHSIAIELTGFCNQRCDYCFNAFRGDGGASVGTASAARTLARLDRILDAVDLEHVTLTGGEPLASHELFPVLDGLRARAVRAQMISNASLVTDALAARLARYRLLSVLVTLNGPDAASHDALVATRGQFDKTVEGIGHLRRHRVPVQGSVVVTRRNATRVGETLAVFAGLGVRTVALSRFSPAGYAVAAARELLPSRADVVAALEHAARAVRDAGLTVFATMPIPQCAVERARFPEVAFHDCPIGTPEQEFALGVRGEVRHCPLHRDAVAGAHDVLDPAVDLAAVFAAGDPHAYRARLPAYCAGCEHAARCGGGCGAAALWVAGAHGLPDPFVTQDPPDPARARRTLPVFAG